MERISHSVGHGGMNLQSDVGIVQTLLNRHRTAAQSLLMVDSVAGGLTIAAIKEFQARVVKMPKPDGRVDPQGVTAEFLYTSPAWISFHDTAKYLNGLVATVESQFKKAAAGLSSVLPNNMFSQRDQIAWGAKVSPEFKAIQRRHKKLDTLESVYFAILDSSAIGKANDATVFKGGTKEYKSNKGLDKNKDGQITVSEVTAKIRAMYQKGLQQGYLG